MGESIHAVVVHSQSERFNGLKGALDGLGITTHRARTCKEASFLLKDSNYAELVFTDTSLPDGTWLDVLKLAERSTDYLPVIVMSREANVDLYLNVLDEGAFGFITPPFLAGELAHIIRSAVYQELVSKSLQAVAVS